MYIRMYVRIVRILKSLCKCFEMINFTSSFRTKKSMLYDVLKIFKQYCYTLSI
jgi:hypothetical protein